MYTLLTKSLPVNMVGLQPSFLVKERQPSPRYSQKQPSGSVLWNSCSKTFHKTLRKPPVVEWFSSLKYIYPNELFLQKFLKILKAAFLTLFGNCFRGTKNLQEAAVRRSSLKQLFWNICENYQETIYHSVFW